ncbi:MAG: NAD(P)H-dependent oxidoreductase subunit E [Chitinispirillia bacterium]|nr:NAD(P)H-dependent oxidoreductase subunit E [Chitinispirillia bacterium]
MKKHKVTICTGTACFVMGGSELLLLEEQLPDDLKAITEIEGSPCNSICKRSEYGGAQADHAPFAQVDDAVIEQASVQKIIAHLKTLEA